MAKKTNTLNDQAYALGIDPSGYNDEKALQDRIAQVQAEHDAFTVDHGTENDGKTPEVTNPLVMNTENTPSQKEAK